MPEGNPLILSGIFVFYALFRQFYAVYFMFSLLIL